MAPVMRRLLPALLLLFVPACEDQHAKAPPTGATPASPPQQPSLLLEHDFGMLPHGARRVHEFELDLDALGEPFVPLRVHIACSCGRADVRLRKADGSERFVDGSGYAYNRPEPDERAILHIELDTSRKEAVDLPMTQSQGYVFLQQLSDATGMARIKWPFVLRFGIDAPVVLHPFAEFDLGSVPLSSNGKGMTTLRGDERHADMTFSNARCDDPEVTVRLEPNEDRVDLHVSVPPRELGSHMAVVTVDTSLDGYQVALPVRWKVVPDLVATPMPKVTFSTPLDEPQGEDQMQFQSVLVADHDRDRSPEFVVLELVDGRGADASSHFAVSLQPLPGRPRVSRLQVRYLGGLQAAFRGKIVLSKRDAPDALLPIDLVVFPAKRP